jgi:hypothetical protein
MKRNSLLAMAAMAMLAAPGMVAVSGAKPLSPLPEAKHRQPRPKATVPAAPTEWDNASVNTRQVRRQSERLAAKGRTDAPPAWMLGTRRGSSRYMPHIGKKERGRYAKAGA